jgi:hypothetical protein
VQQCARLRARHERRLRGVPAIDEELPHGAQSGRLGGGEEHRAGQAEHRQRRVVGADGLHDGRGLLLVVHDGVVQRAVRLDVAHAGAGHPAHAVQRSDLVDDVVGQLLGGDVEEPAAEPGQIAIADLRPDRDPS